MFGFKQFAFLLFCCCVVVSGKKFGKRCRKKPRCPVRVTAVQKECTADALGILRLENTELEFCDGKEWRKVVTKGKDPRDNPGSSCKEIKDNHPDAESGVYWLDPNGGDHSDAFQAYCDMTSFGGGWTMCYTSDNLVKMRTEIDSPGINYGENGYRSNCNNITFTEILFVNETNDQRAYFSRASGGELVADGNYGQQANAYGLWNAHGVADTSYQYQLNICDTFFYSGFMITGYTNCYKQCNTWCGDGNSDFYRTAANTFGYSGVAFKENGHRPLPKKLMSVGLR